MGEFKVGDKVWKTQSGSIWAGVLVGGFRRLDGSLHCVIETREHMIFVSDVSSLKPITELETSHAAS